MQRNVKPVTEMIDNFGQQLPPLGYGYTKTWNGETLSVQGFETGQEAYDAFMSFAKGSNWKWRNHWWQLWLPQAPINPRERSTRSRQEPRQTT